jgi:hypothetical protein
VRGVVLAIAAVLMASPGRGDVIEQFPNACPEGQYLDLQSACAPLIRPDSGFGRTDFLAAFEPFASNVQLLSQCDEAELQAALAAAAQAGGGIVAIPACTISISTRLEVPSNTILRGSGPTTRLVAVPGFAVHMLNVESQNVVIQDLSLVGSAAFGKGLVIRHSRNVLVERMNIHAFGHSNLVFRNSRGITIRYTQSTSAREFHGIESKDCTTRDPAIPDDYECNVAALPVLYGETFTVDYSVYSNFIANNGDHGLDIHASGGEIAGNFSLGNTYAAKFPDAMNVLIHHNRFDSGLGLKFYNTYSIPGRWVRDIVLYRNEFRIVDGDYTFRGDPGIEEIYVIDNQYDSQDWHLIVNPSDTLYACAQTQDVEEVTYTFHPSRAAPAELCDATFLPEPSFPAMIGVALPVLALLARRRARDRGRAERPAPNT